MCPSMIIGIELPSLISTFTSNNQQETEKLLVTVEKEYIRNNYKLAFKLSTLWLKMIRQVIRTFG